MADAKISFRIDAKQKSLWVQEAEKCGVTLTNYLLYLIDVDNQRYSSYETKTIVGKTDAEVSEMLKNSENNFKAEFEKQISNAYKKGYQDGINEVINKTLKNK